MREELRHLENVEAPPHEAVFYANREEYVGALVPLLRASIAAGEAVVVVVPQEQAAWLREELGADAEHVRFESMEEIGRNPARIIPAWQDFVDDAHRAGRSFFGIGQPIWATRNTHEMIECQRHEALLNLVFGETTSFRLLCPYDTEALPPEVLAEAERTHPYVLHPDGRQVSGGFGAPDLVSGAFERPLPEPSGPVDTIAIEEGALHAVRAFVADHAREHGLTGTRADDLVLAAHEVATNSLRHGGGSGTVRIWADGPSLVCEVIDAGRIDDAFVGRLRPVADQEGGFGLWLANQLCDLVQIRSFPTGSVVRLHMRR